MEATPVDTNSSQVENKVTTHPFTQLLDANANRLAALAPEYARLKTNKEQNRFVGARLAFLPEGVSQMGDFSLSASDFLDIWRKMDKVFKPFSPDGVTPSVGSRVAAMLCNTYARPRKQNWDNFVMDYWKGTSGDDEGFPPEVRKDKEGLEHYRQRIQEAHQTLIDLRKMLHEKEPFDREDPEDMENLAEGFYAKELEELSQDRDYKIIHDAQDNLGNALSPLLNHSDFHLAEVY